jgi:hypothetical protein
MATWKITSINCILNQKGKQDVVKDVEFFVDDLLSGKVEIPFVDGEFLPYKELTEDMVVNWVKSALTDSGVAYYEDSVAQLQMPATTGYKGLPWG